MKMLFRLLAAVILTVTLSSNSAKAHCEVPCGIYGDSLRIALIAEHITTIEKSMKKITELSAMEKPNYNQLVRWVTNKEEHAAKIQHIVSQYFLHQRIKVTDPKDAKAYKLYTLKLAKLHELLVYSMKSKQTTDLKYIKKLRKTLDDFSHLYFHNHIH
ncbi:superoxide dismutase [Prolixibacteraceae bacterium JC049]|nr:superoxide dismutase [Prolixibacteraceae bacterium JC049]